ncbi:MAG TPA: MOSC domain-containing protein, partial [Trebonia sp.]
EAGQWLSKVAGMDVRLVYLDDPTRRATNPDYSKDGDVVSFADGYPLLLTSEESLERLNEWIADGKHAAEGPLPMTRFRPNVVVAGAAAFAEDGWHLVRIGDLRFRVAKPCGRCVLTTVDPDTAVKGKEPLATLARHRRWDGNVWFGVNLIPDDPRPDGRLHVGDPVQVLG